MLLKIYFSQAPAREEGVGVMGLLGLRLARAREMQGVLDANTTEGLSCARRGAPRCSGTRRAVETRGRVMSAARDRRLKKPHVVSEERMCPAAALGRRTGLCIFPGSSRGRLA